VDLPTLRIEAVWIDGFGKGHLRQTGRQLPGPAILGIGSEQQGRMPRDAYDIVECDRTTCDKAAKDSLSTMTLPGDLVTELTAECEEEKKTSKTELTVVPNPPQCYTGVLGSSALKVYGALQDVEIAQMAWGAAQSLFQSKGGSVRT